MVGPLNPGPTLSRLGRSRGHHKANTGHMDGCAPCPADGVRAAGRTGRNSTNIIFRPLILGVSTARSFGG